MRDHKRHDPNWMVGLLRKRGAARRGEGKRATEVAPPWQRAGGAAHPWEKLKSKKLWAAVVGAAVMALLTQLDAPGELVELVEQVAELILRLSDYIAAS